MKDATRKALGSSEGYDPAKGMVKHRGLSGLEVVAMEHLLNKSLEAQIGEKVLMPRMQSCLQNPVG